MREQGDMREAHWNGIDVVLIQAARVQAGSVQFNDKIAAQPIEGAENRNIRVHPEVRV